MDSFLSFLAVVAFIRLALWMNHRRLQKERKANPIGPYVIRTSHAWSEAPPYMRNLMLQSAGIDDEVARAKLLSTDWYRLPDYAQTGLLKLQMAAEVQASMLADPKGNLKE